MKCVIFLLLTFVFTQSHGYRILCICPTASKSHQIVFHSLMQALADNGHELVLLTTDLVETDNQNVTQIDWSSSYQCDFSNAKNWIGLHFWNIIKMALNDITSVLDRSLSHPDVKSLIKNHKNEHFDAVIVEYLGYTPIYAFAELFKTPLIGFTSVEIDSYQHEMLGNGVHPALHPPNIVGFYEGNTLYKRLWNTLSYMGGVVFYKVFDEIFDNLIYKHFGSRVKSSSVELGKIVDLVVMNTSPFLGSVKPLVPSVIPVGPMNVEPLRKPLPSQLKQFLDQADVGVIYFSFGTMVQSHHLKKNTVKTFLRALNGLKYKVIWKTNDIFDGNFTDKIYTDTWLPQQDVLAHKNVKLFITQGGLPSLQESVYFGVPMIVIPFMTDQLDNAEIIEQKQIGKRLSHQSLSVNLLQRMIQTVIENPKYKQNIVELQQMMKDEPMTPREKAVWWVEYTIRNKHAMRHLKYKGIHLSFYQRYFLDVGCVFFISVLLIVYVLKRSLMKMQKIMCYYRIRIKVKRT